MSWVPVLALAATPREWASRLHRHVADHGGARIPATVLTASDALAERYDVLLADDRTSFLSQRLVRRLHDSGRLVVGLYDPQDPQGKSDLVDWGVDEALPADLPAAELLNAARSAVQQRGLARVPDGMRPMAAPPAAAVRTESVASSPAGRIVEVLGPPGGQGRTEVALGLAAALGADGDRVVLVELDETHAALAPRLGLAPYPNLRAALDWTRQETGRGVNAVQRAEAGLGVLVAGPLPGTLAPVPADDLLTLAGDLARAAEWVVVDAGHARRWTGPIAASTVVVGAATPVGAVRLAGVLDQQSSPVHLVINRAPSSAYRRWEYLEELARAHQPRSLTTVADDRSVYEASWRGRPATRGHFGKAMRRLAAHVRDEGVDA